MSGSVSGSSFSGSSSKSHSSSASLSRSRSGSHKSRYGMHTDSRVFIEKFKCKHHGITECLCGFAGLCQSVACHLYRLPPPAVARSGALTLMTCTLTLPAPCLPPAPDHPLPAMPAKKGALHGTGGPTKTEVLWLSDSQLMSICRIF